ncbi:GroES-like protein [Ceraceosorus guamensis]|uniref:GroES-like protein n=1 Tax=Ceraceosorus guamensis TaxID=1522189 RepID=A0A316VPM4_9BASI|nr:GroES-like protein [Ceraceosorus guamensis]PWN39526.1 GroES-like protein [Ceraceosorus guamensis]
MYSNTCAVLHGPGDLRIESHDITPPQAGEVQIRIEQTGLCGSDLHYYLHGRNGDFALREPMCLGHESAGEVVAIGPASSSTSSEPSATSTPAPLGVLKVGDKVAVEAGVPCRLIECERCAEGRYNLCPRLRFASSAKTFPHLHGTLQRLINWPAWLVHKLPSTLSTTHGALLEPLSVVLQALSRVSFHPGQTVLIMGAGAVGQLACAASKVQGAAYVAAIDIDSDRLEFAKKSEWADAIFTLPRVPNGTQFASDASGMDEVQRRRAQRAQEDQDGMSAAKARAAEALQHFENDEAKIQAGFDVVLECTGVPSCVALSIFMARPGAKVGLIGMGHPIQTLPIGAASLREVDLVGVFRYAHQYPRAIDLLSRWHSSGLSVGTSAEDGRAASVVQAAGLERLISHTFSLEDAQQAFETLRNGKSADGRGVIKVFIENASPK